MGFIITLGLLLCLIALVVGLVRPGAVRCQTRKSVVVRLGLAFVGLTLIGAGLAPGVPEESAGAIAKGHLAASQPEQHVAIADQAEGIAQSPAAATPTAEGPVSKPASKEAAAVDRTGESAPVENRVSGVPAVLFPVVAIVDGDTIKVSIDDKVETLRLIGIDTPETKDPRKPVQCFGKEASAKAAELLSGHQVRLEGDPTQGDRDKYGRLLRYVWREDGLFFNEWMLRNGYAHEYTYNLPYMHQTPFKSAERYASENNLGLWNQATCAGAATEATATPAPAPSVQAGGGGHIFYTSSHSSATFYYCDTDPGWEGLSKGYLKSFPSANELLTSYPSRTLHEACK